jgi:hypothetical protein
VKTLLRKYQLREDASAITQSVPWRGELLRNPTEQQRERVRLEGSCQMTEGEERIRSGDQGSRHTDSEANCRTTQGKEERGVTPKRKKEEFVRMGAQPAHRVVKPSVRAQSSSDAAQNGGQERGQVGGKHQFTPRELKCTRTSDCGCGSSSSASVNSVALSTRPPGVTTRRTLGEPWRTPNTLRADLGDQSSVERST